MTATTTNAAPPPTLRERILSMSNDELRMIVGTTKRRDRYCYKYKKTLNELIARIARALIDARRRAASGAAGMPGSSPSEVAGTLMDLGSDATLPNPYSLPSSRQYRVQFLDASKNVLSDEQAESGIATNVFELVPMDWPLHAVTLRVLDPSGENILTVSKVGKLF